MFAVRLLKALMGALVKLLWNLEEKVYYGIVRLFRGEYSVKITDIKVLYESPFYIVVNKHHDVLMNRESRVECSYKGSYKGSFTVSLERQLERLYPDLVNNKLQFGFYFPHRLDYATSGIVCVAKNKVACGAAGIAFQERKTQKFYLAILRGHISKNMITINDAIGKDSREQFKLIRMAAESMDYCSPKTRPSLTYLAVLERGSCYDYPATKVLLRPITGRRHQLRVHCTSLGHTIVGDFTYSNRKDVSPYRMFLHAYKLHLKSKLETLDITTDDPFTEDNQRNKWEPYEKIMSIPDAVHELLLLPGKV